MTAQSIIIPSASLHARVLIFNLGQLSIGDLKIQIKRLEERHEYWQKKYPQEELKLAISFGENVSLQLFNQLPKGFHNLSTIEGTYTMSAGIADVFMHISSSRADLCFILLNDFCAEITDKIDVIDEQACFRFLDSRDLTGFVDGTENPQTEEDRMEVTLVEDGEFKDCSFVFAQRFIHRLSAWSQHCISEQEQVIGRTKEEDIELDDDIKPINAHIARVVIENEQGEELEILRHSLPYGDATGDKGLFFIAYTHDLNIIDQMLSRMYGTSTDQVADHLLEFTQPQKGFYFFTPSQELLLSVI